MVAITDVTDVEAALGRPIVAPETDQVEAWIARVEGRIRNRIEDLDEKVLDPGYESTLIAVIVDVVIRKIQNPTGMRSERIDDYYYDRGASKADLWPTVDEWAELLPGVSSGAFSVRPGFEPDHYGEWFL